MKSEIADTIPDEEFLLAVAHVETHRRVFDLGEVGFILVGYDEVTYWAKADNLIARGLLLGLGCYRIPKEGEALTLINDFLAELGLSPLGKPTTNQMELIA